MAEPGYKSLLSYKLAQIAFDLGWGLCPFTTVNTKITANAIPDQTGFTLVKTKHRKRVLPKRSLSTKLKLYDVAKASGMEAREDFEDILRRMGLSRWSKDDSRLALKPGRF